MTSQAGIESLFELIVGSLLGPSVPGPRREPCERISEPTISGAMIADKILSRFGTFKIFEKGCFHGGYQHQLGEEREKI